MKTRVRPAIHRLPSSRTAFTWKPALQRSADEARPLSRRPHVRLILKLSTNAISTVRPSPTFPQCTFITLFSRAALTSSPEALSRRQPALCARYARHHAGGATCSARWRLEEHMALRTAAAGPLSKALWGRVVGRWRVTLAE